jgi:hypothetical protein
LPTIPVSDETYQFFLSEAKAYNMTLLEYMDLLAGRVMRE